MAEPVSSDVAPTAGEPPADAEPATEAPRAERPRRRGMFDVRTRFGIAYLALAALVGTAVGLFIVFLGSQGPTSSVWSSFRPKDRGDAAAAEIARHVQSRYRLANGDNLVSVTDRGPSYNVGSNTYQIGTLAIEPTATGGTANVFRTSHTLFYDLCGLLDPSSSCAIPGQPSPARLQLLQREILELSLYSFKYAGADTVVAYAPPTKSGGKTLRVVAVLRRNDWRRALQEPLDATLPSRPVSLPGGLTEREQRLASAVQLYDYRFQALGDGSLVLVAAPLQN